MKPNTTIRKRLLIRKMATLLLISASFAAFATLGDGGGKDGQKTVSAPLTPRSFSLRSTQNFRNMYASSLKPSNFIMLNTVVTYQKGNATYILPLKKKVLLDKVKFNVNAKSGF